MTQSDDTRAGSVGMRRTLRSTSAGSSRMAIVLP